MSESLKSILLDNKGFSNFDLSFTRPKDKPEFTNTTIGLYLYDIRENLDYRSNEPIVSMVDGKAVVKRPPLRLACSYLVTVWPTDTTEQELVKQRILSQILMTLYQYPTIPDKHLKNSLKTQKPPLPLVTLGPELVKPDFWTALGCNMCPSFTTTVTIGMDYAKVEEFPIVTSVYNDVFVGQSLEGETLIQFGGRVTYNGQGVKNAFVFIEDMELNCITDENGCYLFASIPSGLHSIHVYAVGFKPLMSHIKLEKFKSEDFNLILHKQ